MTQTAIALRAAQLNALATYNENRAQVCDETFERRGFAGAWRQARQLRAVAAVQRARANHMLAAAPEAVSKQNEAAPDREPPRSRDQS